MGVIVKNLSVITVAFLASATFAHAAEPKKVEVQQTAAPVQTVTQTTTDSEKKEEATKADMALTPLNRALIETYQKNPQLEAQRKAQNALDERVPQALSGAMPTASAGYEEGRRRTRNAPRDFSYRDAKTKTLTVNQPLFRGGSVWANTKSARREVAAGQQRLRQAEQDVLLNTITSYMDVVQAQSVVELSKKNLDVLSKQMEATTQRFDVGEDTRTDVAQSEARVAAARSQLTQNEGRLAETKAAFKRFVGYDANGLLMPESHPALPKALEEAVALAEKNNPRVLESQQLKESADYQINSTMGRILPSVDLRGRVNRQEGVGAFGLTNFDQDDVMLAVSVPIFQGGAEYSRVREAKEQYQQRRFSQLEVGNQVRQQVISAWENWQAATASIISDRASIDAAKIALDGVRQEQQYGARTTLDVLDAERELFDAEVRLVQSRRNEVVAAYTLMGATGQLTAAALELPVDVYDPNKHFEDVEYQFIGF